MKIRVMLATAALFSLVGTPAALAADSTSSASADPAAAARVERPWKIFGGVGLGIGSVNGNSAESASGPQYLLGAELSLYPKGWVVSGGTGWFFSNLSGETASGVTSRIRTRAGLLELGVRKRLGARWQLGPIYQLAFGADTGFAPSVGDAFGTSMLGLKGAYEIPNQGFPIRAFAQASTDVSVPGRRILMAMTGVQLGFSFGGSTSAPIRDQVESVSAAPMAVASKSDYRLVLDSQRVFFSTNSFEIRPDVLRILTEAASYLERNPGDWKKIEIQGHADQRGKFEYNLKLSRRRAEAVEKVLAKTPGLEDRLESKAFSYSQPLDTANRPSAWSVNRRVEIVFHQFEPTPEFLRIVRGLRKQVPGDFISRRPKANGSKQG